MGDEQLMPQAGDIADPGDIPGKIGTTLGTADLTATSAATEKTVDTLTVPVIAGRTYTIRYIFHYAWASGSTGDCYGMRIREGNASGAQLTYSNADIVNAAGAVHTRVAEVEWVAPTTGNQQFTTTIQRLSGSGTCIVRGAASQPRKLTVFREA